MSWVVSGRVKGGRSKPRPGARTPAAAPASGGGAPAAAVFTLAFPSPSLNTTISTAIRTSGPQVATTAPIPAGASLPGEAAGTGEIGARPFTVVSLLY